MGKTEISIIIPAYNEAQNIGKVISDIRAIHPDLEIIVVDDGSSDGTGAVASDSGAMVYKHPYNIGNGAAIKSGIRIASGQIMVFMDADNQHDPADLKKLMEHIPEFDMVVGARPKGDHASWVRALGNRIYNRLASYVSKFNVQDLTSGFRVVKADIAHNLLYLLPNTYSYPTTLTLGVLRTGRSIKYVPIRGQTRKMGKSEVKIVRDGVRFFMIIIKICTLYSPMRVFLPVSFVMFCTGLGYYFYTLVTSNRFTNMSALLFITSILVFMMGLISEQISQMRFERSEGDKFV